MGGQNPPKKYNESWSTGGSEPKTAALYQPPAKRPSGRPVPRPPAGPPRRESYPPTRVQPTRPTPSTARAPGDVLRPLNPRNMWGPVPGPIPQKGKALVDYAPPGGTPGQRKRQAQVDTAWAGNNRSYEADIQTIADLFKFILTNRIEEPEATPIRGY
jgi:hypothetical protein